MRRRVGLFSMVSLVLPLAVAASASAQGAVLRVSKQVVTPGEVITLQGQSFSAAGVDIRIGATRDSQVVREANGPSFSINLPIPPSLSPGWHLIQATQVTDAGRHRGFTPGRARIRVVAAASGAALPPAGGPTGTEPPAPLAAAILALALLAGISTLTVRRLRTLNRALGN